MVPRPTMTLCVSSRSPLRSAETPVQRVGTPEIEASDTGTPKPPSCGPPLSRYYMALRSAVDKLISPCWARHTTDSLVRPSSQRPSSPWWWQVHGWQADICSGPTGPVRGIWLPDRDLQLISLQAALAAASLLIGGEAAGKVFILGIVLSPH